MTGKERKKKRLVVGCLFVLVPALVVVTVTYRLGKWRPNRPNVFQYPVLGIDVSHHQGSIDWARVKAAGVDFAYVKATEGDQLLDPAFQLNWDSSHAAGLPHGAYLYFGFNSTAEEQAKLFYAVVPVEGDALPPAVDFEMLPHDVDLKIDRIDIRTQALRLIELLRTHYHKEPLVYISPEFKSTYLAKDTLARPWYASYFGRPAHCQVWQYSDFGFVDGIGGQVDMDVLDQGVSLSDLRRMVAGIPGAPSTRVQNELSL